MFSLSALILTMRLFLVGLSVGWPLMDRIGREGSPLKRSIICGSVALLVGLSVNLLTVLLLGEAGLYHRHGVENPLLGLLVITGLSWGYLRGKSSLKSFILHGVPAAAIFFLGVVVILALPNRCEWIVGGWDPGIYVNEGVALERQGTFHPSDLLFSTSLSEEEKALFTRTGFGRTERFPGVVVDGGRNSFTFEFFRLMPSMVAMLHRTGGLEMTVKANTILGLLCAMFFAAMVIQFTSASHSLLATLLFMAQPVWLYHAQVPVSEMLHLSLLLGLGVMLPWRARGVWAPMILGLLFFSLMLNRYSFLPLAGLAMATLAMADSVRDDRRRVFTEHLIMAAAIAAGAALDLYIAPVTPGTWLPRPPLEKVFLLLTGAVLAIDVLGGKAFFRKAAAPPRVIRYPAALAGAGAAVAVYIVRTAPKGPQADNLFRLVSYMSLPVTIAALAGCLLFFLPRKNHDLLSKWFITFFLGVTALFIYDKHIVDIYPWATRRYLPYTVPAFSFLAAYPAAALWSMKRHRRPAKVLTLALLLILFAGTARKSWHAWSRVELQGAVTVIAQTAAQINDDDIVIVDSPRWGTPLALIHGKEVLNGKHLWRRKSVEGMEKGLAVLARLHFEGYRIRFLTSTISHGLDIFPLPVEPVTLDWESGEFVLKGMIHSRRATDFVVSDGTYRLRLYTWTPAPP